MKNSRVEDIVLICLVTVGMIGGAYLYFRPEGKPIAAIFLAFGLASLVYRFLGGIANDTSFKSGLFKLGGSAAFTIGTILVLNNLVFKTKTTGDIIIESPKSRWFPVRIDTGLPDTLKIQNGSDEPSIITLEKEDSRTLLNHQYYINKKGEIVHDRDSTHSIGTLNKDRSDFDLFNGIERFKDLRTFYLYPFDSNKPSEFQGNFPFIVKCYSGYFDILNASSGKPVNSDTQKIEPSAKVSRVFSIAGRTYFVIVAGAVHPQERRSRENWFSHYIVGEIIQR